jgi:putative ATP-dependent endonuclease of OLD family
MYLAKLEIENFRVFGTGEDKKGFITFQPGLNVLVGENDSGKTCVIDAIRLLVGTVTQDYFPVQDSDFHVETGSKPASAFTILGEFRGLNAVEAGALLEYLSVEGTGDESEFYLRMWLKAQRDEREFVSPRRRPITHDIRAGSDEDGKRVEGAARDFLRATYLKPLRDAITEMTARKGSRLSQVLRAYPGIKDQERDDWDRNDVDSKPKTLVGIMRQTENNLRGVDVIQHATEDVNQTYLERFSLGDAPLRGDINVRANSLQQILERLELSLNGVAEGVTCGLGISNFLFIATELLALSPWNEFDPEFPLLLFEEPEAHLEPQRQMLLIEFLRERSKRTPTSPQDKMQIILTTHSPNLASKIGVKDLIIMNKGQAFPMGSQFTRLDQSDYEFLERFLDVTKSNLFFARGVLIVEGDAEALLIPTLARKIGRPLTKNGVSIVKVGHVGLFRYSRVFQRKNNPQMPIRVACITDRDIPPLEAKPLLSAERKTENECSAAEISDRLNTRKADQGGPVTIEVSPCWTFEFDLALTDMAPYINIAVALARPANPTHACFPVGTQAKDIVRAASKEYEQWNSGGKSKKEIAVLIYEPLLTRKASKADAAQCLASLLEKRHCGPKWDEARWREVLPNYIVKAIDFATGATIATSIEGDRGDEADEAS